MPTRPRRIQALALAALFLVPCAYPAKRRGRRKLDPKRRAAAWKKYFRGGERRAEKGDHAKAIQYLRRALKLALMKPVMLEEASRTLAALAAAYAATDASERREKVLRKLLLVEKKRGMPGKARIPVLTQLEELVRTRGALEEANELLIRLVGLYPEGGGGEAAKLEALLERALSIEGAPLENRLDWLNRLIRLRQVTLGRPLLEVARTRARLSQVQYDGNLAADGDISAERAELEALAASSTFPAEAAALLEELAVLVEKREGGAAVAANRRMLAGLLTKEGSNRIPIAMALDEGGARMRQDGDLEFAAELLAAATPASFGREQADVRKTAQNLLQVVVPLKRDEKHPVIVRVLTVAGAALVTSLGEEDMNTARIFLRLGESQRALRDDAPAAASYGKAADIYAALGDRGHLEGLQARKGQGEALRDAGDSQAAMEAFQVMLDDVNRKAGEGSMQSIHPLHMIGLLAKEMGDTNLALEKLDEAYSLQELNKAYGRRAKAETNLALADLYKDLGRWDEADHHIGRAKYYGATRQELKPIIDVVGPNIR